MEWQLVGGFQFFSLFSFLPAMMIIWLTVKLIFDRAVEKLICWFGLLFYGWKQMRILCENAKPC